MTIIPIIISNMTPNETNMAVSFYLLMLIIKITNYILFVSGIYAFVRGTIEKDNTIKTTGIVVAIITLLMPYIIKACICVDLFSIKILF